MSYWDQATLAGDGEFLQRVAACVSNEDPAPADPPSWAYDHRWQVAAAPGFADAYASAIAADVPNPGRDPAVISDAQILAAVQALLGGTTTEGSDTDE